MSRKATVLSTRTSPGRPSTRSPMMLRRISSEPPSIRVAGERISIFWKRPCRGWSSPISTPAAPCRSRANMASSCMAAPATSLPMEFSGPGVWPLDRAVMARMPVYFSPLCRTA